MTDYIYALCDPKTEEIKYIGKTDNPPERFQNHLHEPSRCHKKNWINTLQRRGLKPVLKIIEELNDGQNWEEREIYWISYYRSIGVKLANQTNGGDCGPDCTGMHLKKSPEAIEKYRAHLAIHNRTPRMRELSRKNGERRRILSLTGDAGDKLTKNQVLEIRSQSEFSHKELAKKYGVSNTMIRYIQTRHSWKHV